ncbi:MAG TPA: hypothetical protein VJS43_15785, partial [Candidatus Acidoferrales bacterium]|nr:hypothetical protein [Candidatus Acidoferrales bacterium]
MRRPPSAAKRADSLFSRLSHCSSKKFAIGLTLAAAIGLPWSPADADPKDNKETFDYSACKTSGCVTEHTRNVRDHYDPAACKT